MRTLSQHMLIYSLLQLSYSLVHTWYKDENMHKIQGKARQGNSTCQASCVHCAELRRPQPAVAEPVHRSNTCAHTGQTQPGHECTTRVGLLLVQKQIPRAGVAELQLGELEHCISSDHQRHALHHAWRDTVQNDWMGHLYYHLYITVKHHIIYFN